MASVAAPDVVDQRAIHPAGIAAALPFDHVDIQRPHVSPDSGISSGGSPLPPIASPYSTSGDTRTTGSHSTHPSGARPLSVDGQHTDQLLNYMDSSVNSSPDAPLPKAPSKRGRKPYKHLLSYTRHDMKSKASYKSNIANDSALQVAAKKRGRPKGSKNKKKTLLQSNSSDSSNIVTTNATNANDKTMDTVVDPRLDVDQTQSCGNEALSPAANMSKQNAGFTLISKRSALSSKLPTSIKRGRGRPRIHPLPPSIKPRRGRPKKILQQNQVIIVRRLHLKCDKVLKVLHLFTQSKTSRKTRRQR